MQGETAKSRRVIRRVTLGEKPIAIRRRRVMEKKTAKLRKEKPPSYAEVFFAKLRV